ncbi:MAG: glycoside hydrolase family 130 protein [Planctomycetes bacterium]|nr:glycoside hydrolase family 130 protein [Planctomycetota bacterium]
MPRRGIVVTRTQHRLLPDPRRVITKPYLPGEQEFPNGKSRVALVIERVLAIPQDKVSAMLGKVLAEFSSRHRDFEQVLEHHFHLVAHHLSNGAQPSREHRLLIGAYFTHEYSIEAAALFNPSIVPAPQQHDLPPQERRFLMSVRAVGEGHISSVEFRTGVINAQCNITFDPTSHFAITGTRKSPMYDKHLFGVKLAELGASNEIVSAVLAQMEPHFTYDELEHAIGSLPHTPVPRTIAYETIKLIHWLATSNYVVSFPRTSAISERVIFPAGPNESRGMEDARFVRFVNDDGSTVYYATYTAFDGFEILPQLIETEDFVSFRIATLNGACAQNKGMALFPRLIDGKYAALSRYDRENISLMTSDNVRLWNKTEELRTPVRPWELIQIGNCGSPIETEAGWLVLTHGVGPMRRYTIGAMLLDLQDPRRVISNLPDPLMTPNDYEREGYVPNVLYSCGAMVHNGQLILPYGFSDHGTGIALVPLNDLLALLLEHRCD